MLYLASQKIVERWTQRCRNWNIVLSQLKTIFEGRITAWFAPERSISHPSKMVSRWGVHNFTQTGINVDTEQIYHHDCPQSCCFLLLDNICFTQKIMG